MWKRTPKKFVEFCDFVLWDFDHRNFAFVFVKFLLYWAKYTANWGMQVVGMVFQTRSAQWNKINKFFRDSC
ncbi:DUF6783 domain-containing protein [Anaerobutyricum hallii]|uniref:DUF6783 domain-containing protein n=1 Tax=Anaerobutyricum hallii TaxID=39488 RepID=UPI003A85C8D9